MNLPNKLTVVRVIMIPVFLLFFFWKSLPLNYLWAFIIFATASLTDMLDGQIARKNNLVTDFGKLMDPLADKLLVMSALICILGENLFVMISNPQANRTVCLIALILIMSREFVVTSIRLIAAGNGVVIAADKWGKFKTISQMTWISLVLFSLSFNWAVIFSPIAIVFQWASYILFFAMVILTVGSGANYVVKNKNLFADA